MCFTLAQSEQACGYLLFNDYSEFVYCCQKCNSEFQTGPYLEAHILSEHQDQKRQIFVNDGIYIGDQIFESQPDELDDIDETGVMEEDDSGHCDEYQSAENVSNASYDEQANEKEQEEEEEDNEDYDEEEEAVSTESTDERDEREEEEEIASTQADGEREAEEEEESNEVTEQTTNERVPSEEVLNAHTVNEFTVNGEIVSVANNEQAMTEQATTEQVVIEQVENATEAQAKEDDNHATVENGSTDDSVNIVNVSVENAVIATKLIEVSMPKKRIGRPPGSKNKKKSIDSSATLQNEAHKNSPALIAPGCSHAQINGSVPKKRMGRPPASKNKEIVVTNNVANIEKIQRQKVNISAPKKRMGRPPGSKNKENIVENDAANARRQEPPKECRKQNESVPKKRMGRPPGSKNKENIIENDAANAGRQEAPEESQRNTLDTSVPKKRMGRPPGSKNKENIIENDAANAGQQEALEENQPNKLDTSVPKKRMGRPPRSKNKENIVENDVAAHQQEESETQKPIMHKLRDRSKICKKRRYSSEYEMPKPNPRKQRNHQKIDSNDQINAQTENDGTIDAVDPAEKYSLVVKVDTIQLQNDLTTTKLTASTVENHDTISPNMSSEGCIAVTNSSPAQADDVPAEEMPIPAKRKRRSRKNPISTNHTASEQKTTVHDRPVKQPINNDSKCQPMREATTIKRKIVRRSIYHCEMCPGESFDGKPNLHKHMRKHRPTKLKQCELCGKHPKLYDYHMQMYHSPFECKFCHAIFRTRENHELHERRHTGERPFLCVLCGKKFRTPTGLRKHEQQVHVQQKVHKCPHCDTSFHSKFQINDHINQMHSKERPHLCDMCGKCFASRRYLQVHKHIHGERRLKCRYCPQDFKLFNNRRVHEKKVHQVV